MAKAAAAVEAAEEAARKAFREHKEREETKRQREETRRRRDEETKRRREEEKADAKPRKKAKKKAKAEEIVWTAPMLEALQAGVDAQLEAHGASVDIDYDAIYYGDPVFLKNPRIFKVEHLWEKYEAMHPPL